MDIKALHDALLAVEARIEDTRLELENVFACARELRDAGLPPEIAAGRKAYWDMVGKTYEGQNRNDCIDAAIRAALAAKQN